MKDLQSSLHGPLRSIPCAGREAIPRVSLCVVCHALCAGLGARPCRKPWSTRECQPPKQASLPACPPGQQSSPQPTPWEEATSKTMSWEAARGHFPGLGGHLWPIACCTPSFIQDLLCASSRLALGSRDRRAECSRLPACARPLPLPSPSRSVVENLRVSQVLISNFDLVFVARDQHPSGATDAGSSRGVRFSRGAPLGGSPPCLPSSHQFTLLLRL